MKLKENWMAIGFFIVAAVLIFWRINDSYVAFTDEVLFEEASYRMAFGSPELKMSRLNEVLIPINEGKVWLEKPPLYFWMTALVFHVSRIAYHVSNIQIFPLTDEVMRRGEFVFPWIRRFWTDVAGVVIVMLVYGITKELFSIRRQDYKKTKVKSNGILNQVQDDGGAERVEKNVGLLAGFLLLASPLFLATTKSASLDMTATMWMTGAIYWYLKIRNFLLYQQSDPLPHQRFYPILCGLFIGLGLMTRSFLALTPIALIIFDQIVFSFPKGAPSGKFPVSSSKKSIFKFVDGASLGTIFVTATLIAIPWHLYMLYLFDGEFSRTYLGFNVLQHAVELTPGYGSTSWWFYLIQLIKQVPWLLPMGIGSSVFVLYGRIKGRFKLDSNQNSEVRIRKLEDNKKILKRVQDDNNSIWVLAIWLLLPLVILSLSATRHEWYLVQIMPPLAIVMALLMSKAYEVVKSCDQCLMTKYLTEIAFLTFTLAGLISVLTVADPSTPTVKAVRWARENLPTGSPVYVYKQWFLPQTMLFHPVKVVLVNDQELDQLLSSKQEVAVFVADIYKDEVMNKEPELKPVREFKLGKIYTTSNR